MSKEYNIFSEADLAALYNYVDMLVRAKNPGQSLDKEQQQRILWLQKSLHDARMRERELAAKLEQAQTCSNIETGKGVEADLELRRQIEEVFSTWTSLAEKFLISRSFYPLNPDLPNSNRYDYARTTLVSDNRIPTISSPAYWKKIGQELLAGAPRQEKMDPQKVCAHIWRQYLDYMGIDNMGVILTEIESLGKRVDGLPAHLQAFFRSGNAMHEYFEQVIAVLDAIKQLSASELDQIILNNWICESASQFNQERKQLATKDKSLAKKLLARRRKIRDAMCLLQISEKQDKLNNFDKNLRPLGGMARRIAESKA